MRDFDDDYKVDLGRLSGRQIDRLPVSIQEELESDGSIHCSSLTAITGCNPHDGAIFDTTTMAAVVGKKDRYDLENIIANEPEFEFVYRDFNFYATYPNSLTTQWQLRQDKINIRRNENAKNNLLRNITRTDCSSDYLE